MTKKLLYGDLVKLKCPQYGIKYGMVTSEIDSDGEIFIRSHQDYGGAYVKVTNLKRISLTDLLQAANLGDVKTGL